MDKVSSNILPAWSYNLFCLCHLGSVIFNTISLVIVIGICGCHKYLLGQIK